MKRLLVAVLVLAACGAPAATSSTVVAPDDPSVEIDPQACEVDADCMVGTPRNCCASWCPTDRQAWSLARWNEYQAECAEEECPAPEDAACPPVEPPPAVAVCRESRCVLSFP